MKGGSQSLCLKAYPPSYGIIDCRPSSLAGCTPMQIIFILDKQTPDMRKARTPRPLFKDRAKLVPITAQGVFFSRVPAYSAMKTQIFL